MVAACPAYHHRPSLGNLGIGGKLPRYLNNRCTADAGILFLPCRRKALVVVIALGKIA